MTFNHINLSYFLTNFKSIKHCFIHALLKLLQTLVYILVNEKIGNNFGNKCM